MDQDIIGRILGLGLQKNQFVVIESGKLNSLGEDKKNNTGRSDSHPFWQPSHLRRRIEDAICT